jgi:hypothetical protein
VFALPMGDARLAGIAAEDIGRCAHGIFRDGGRWIDRNVGVAGDHLTGTEMAATLAAALGREVRYQAIPFDAYRKLGFPGADDLEQGPHSARLTLPETDSPAWRGAVGVPGLRPSHRQLFALVDVRRRLVRLHRRHRLRRCLHQKIVGGHLLLDRLGLARLPEPACIVMTHDVSRSSVASPCRRLFAFAPVRKYYAARDAARNGPRRYSRR